jgi:hypothetical protein
VLYTLLISFSHFACLLAGAAFGGGSVWSVVCEACAVAGGDRDILPQEEELDLAMQWLLGRARSGTESEVA